jgi:hypothetical protein
MMEVYNVRKASRADWWAEYAHRLREYSGSCSCCAGVESVPVESWAFVSSGLVHAWRVFDSHGFAGLYLRRLRFLVDRGRRLSGVGLHSSGVAQVGGVFVVEGAGVLMPLLPLPEAVESRFYLLTGAGVEMYLPVQVGRRRVQVRGVPVDWGGVVFSVVPTSQSLALCRWLLRRLKRCR